MKTLVRHLATGLMCLAVAGTWLVLLWAWFA